VVLADLPELVQKGLTDVVLGFDQPALQSFHPPFVGDVGVQASIPVGARLSARPSRGFLHGILEQGLAR
jgi:hypothetical protein